MDNRKKKTIVSLIISGTSFILGLFLYFLVTTFQFIGIILMGLSLIVFIETLIGILHEKHLVLSKILCFTFSIIVFLIIFSVIVTGTLIVNYSNMRPDVKCNYIVVLGAGLEGTSPSLTLQERLNAAYRYLTENPETQCIVSGGQGVDEKISEAECMVQYLTDAGISGDRILMEDQACNTVENIQLSLDLVEKETGARPKLIGIVSNDYHIFRAVKIAKKLGIEAVGIPADSTIWTVKVNYYLREIAAVWYYCLLGG